jgi:hypothetical protein
VTYALAGATAGLTAFLVITKGATLVHTFTTAVKALTAAIASNPFGAIAVVITSVLIPALIYLYKNWDSISTYLQQGLARIQYAFSWLGSVIEEGLVVAFYAVKAAAATFVDFIYGNIIRAIGNMLDIMGKLPFVGDLFEAASDKVKGLGDAMGQMAEDTRQASADAIQAAQEKQNAVEEELNSTLKAIDTESKARRDAIEAQKNGNKEIVENEELTQEELYEIKTEGAVELNKALLETEALQDEALLELKQEHDAAMLEEEEIYTASLMEVLNQIPLTEQQLQTQRIDQFTQFLQQRWNLEETDGLNKITWLQQQQNEIMAMETLNGEQKIALAKSVNKMVLDEDTKLKDSQKKLEEQRLSAVGSFFGGINKLASESAKHNRGLAVVEKMTAAAEAAINSALAFTKALASSPPPMNYVLAAGVLATGIAQQVKIMGTNIPSAETGGRFIVPNSIGSDSTYMRVNSGEEVNVTPRGETGFSGTQRITVQLEKQTIFDVVNNGIRSGDVILAVAGSNY